MGASPNLDEPRSVPAAVMSTTTPEVRVEDADSDEPSVFVEGTMFHAGLNANHWGLSKAGAQAIADDLRGRDYTAAHPEVKGMKYDRSIAEGQGAPIGTVRSTDVVEVNGASVDGGQYTASYVTQVKDPVFKERLQAGVYDGDGYGVSIGIYADPESATCSVCTNPMASDDCEHSRGETVEADDGEEVTAGPLYDDGTSDHLAHVWRPAYEGATADVAAASDGGLAGYSESSAQQVLTASEVLGAPFDATESADSTEPDDTEDETDSDAYRVHLASDTTAQRRDRGSYPVKFKDND